MYFLTVSSMPIAENFNVFIWRFCAPKKWGRAARESPWAGRPWSTWFSFRLTDSLRWTPEKRAIPIAGFRWVGRSRSQSPSRTPSTPSGGRPSTSTGTKSWTALWRSPSGIKMSGLKMILWEGDKKYIFINI